MSELNRSLGELFKAYHHQQKEAARENARDRYHAKKLAARHGITLDVEMQRGPFNEVSWECWICDARFDGHQFCTTWREVREKLEAFEDEQTTEDAA